MIGIDFEYIKENAPQGNDPGDRPDVKATYCELVQIGACKLDQYGKEIGSLNIMVKPHTIQTLPPWFTEMTGITKERRDLGVTFLEALTQLKDFMGQDDSVWTFNGDWFILEGNLRAHTLSNPFTQPFNRLKPLLNEHGIDLEKFKEVGLKEIQSGGLYKVLGINLPKINGIGEHDAEHDARSLIHSAYHLGIR